MSKYIGDVSAYAYAVSKGYTGTEEEFAELMASYADVGQTAVDAKDAAVAAKTAAQTAATTATNKASEATTAAQTATTKAGEAQTSAQTASTKASEASQSASQASGYAQTAETAKTDAQTAKTQAETARDNAVTAKTAAETAQGKAEDAQAAAESVAESIPSDYSQLSEDVSDLKEGLTQKANQDGYYADLVSGGSTQLLSDMVETDTTPYNYRTAGGSLEIGDRMKLKKIVGGSLAVNQLAGYNATAGSTTSSGVTFTINSDGSVDVSGEASAQVPFNIGTRVDGHAGHVRFVKGCPIGGSTSSYALKDGYGNVRDIGNGCIDKINNDYSIAQIIIASGYSITGTLKFKPQIFDITAMFGTTIADYIYGLETATAGAGVAWLKAHFPRIFDAGYIPYNAGTLEHVSGLSAHKMTGFNQWDEEWEVGGISTNTGANESASDIIRSKNYIDVLPNTAYYCTYANGTAVYNCFFYDSDKNFISHAVTNNGLVTTPSNCAFMRFRCRASYGTTYKHDICINISSPSRNGEYEEYVKHSYPLDNSLTLRGVPKLDSFNNLYYDGDEYESDGTVTRKYGIVDLGTLNWVYISASGKLYAVLNSMARPGLLMCTAYPQSFAFNAEEIPDKTIWNQGYAYNAKNIVVYDTAYTDSASFKTAMSGVMLCYELATPTTETADSYQSLQICDPNGTEEFVSTGIVPVGHETRYPENLRAKIEGLPWDFSSIIAPTEKTTTASRNYTTGSLLIMGNVLYKVTANIANGGTITPNTNVTATTLSEILSALTQ